VLPASLVVSAFELRARMLRCADYQLDDEREQRELARIRSGSGHVDLADDLSALARLYEIHQKALAKDQKSFRAEDAGAARALASSIQEHLGKGASKATRAAATAWASAFASLREAHDELVAAARFLDRGAEDPEQLYPSLFSRAASRRRDKTPKTPKPTPPSS
jgi:hypothetical protein